MILTRFTYCMLESTVAVTPGQSIPYRSKILGSALKGGCIKLCDMANTAAPFRTCQSCGNLRSLVQYLGACKFSNDSFGSEVP